MSKHIPRPDFRALYYRDFNPTHFRRKDGMRVQVVGPYTDTVVYTDGKNTHAVTSAKFNTLFATKD